MLTCKHLGLVGLQGADKVPLYVGGELREGENGSAELTASVAELPTHLLGLVYQLLGIVLSKMAHAVLVQCENVGCGLELGDGDEARLYESEKTSSVSGSSLRTYSPTHLVPRCSI